MTASTALVIAHRGASGYRPEHTAAAFLLGIALGADAVEPDLVLSRDGVLVIRHENDISTTTDVEHRPEFESRRTTKAVDGHALTGWFTEDFSWAELATLRAIEPLPSLRARCAAFDGWYPMLRFSDLLALLDAAERPVRLVAELKHVAYFRSFGFDLPRLFAAELAEAGWTEDPRLTVESFELSALRAARAAGVTAPAIYLLEASGAPVDAPNLPYADTLTNAGLTALADSGIAGISVDKDLILQPDAAGTLVATNLVSRAHAAGLTVFCWTLRAENAYLFAQNRSSSGAADAGASGQRGPRGANGQYGEWAREFGQLLNAGVDGVFADQPDLVLAVRDR
ncbi:MAG: glycerophosphodiester phosphodiesterase [Microbacteriaceae bacterium]|nr:glycerophosphodiester phosphodiesterase [Microbacteriaceae bacterium]